MKTQAVLFRNVDDVSIELIDAPPPGPGEVLVKTLFSVISPGTELRCLAGRQPNPVAWPYIPGYSLSGEVIETGDGVTIAPGTRIFCTGTRHADVGLMWGGHVAHAVTSAASVYPAPESIEAVELAAVHLAAIAYHGLRLARPLLHETIAVLGLGAIGQLSARLFAASGARVLATDVSPERVGLASVPGIEAFLSKGNLVDSVRARLPDGADIVVDATGAIPVLPQAIEIARELRWDDSPLQGARIVIQGSYAGDFSIPYQAAFQKEAHILIPRDMQPSDVRAVLDLMARGRLSIGSLIGSVVSPYDAPAIYQKLRDAPAELVTAAIRWN